MIRRLLTIAAVLVGAIGAIVASAPPVAAHADFIGSTPADGSTVVEAPTVVVLEFSEPASSTAAEFQLFDPSGALVPGVTLVTTTSPSASFELTLPGGLGTGTHAVVWQGLVSLEGHGISGQIRFNVGAPTAGGAVLVAPADDTASWVDTSTDAVKALWFVAFALVIGALVLMAWGLARSPVPTSAEALAIAPGVVALGDGDGSLQQDLAPTGAGIPGDGALGDGLLGDGLLAVDDRVDAETSNEFAREPRRVLVDAARRLLIPGVVGLAAATVARLVLTVAAFGSGTINGDAWRAAFDVRTGDLALKSVAVMIPIVWAVTMMRRATRPIDLGALAGLLAVLGVFEVASGHSGSGERAGAAVVVTTVHLVAMGVWLGPLLGLVLLGGPAWSALDQHDRRSTRLAFLARYGRVGGTALVIVVLTGVITARDRVGWSFWDEGNYGTLLTLKAAIAAVVVVPLALWHRMHLNRPEPEPARFVSSRPFGRTLRLEIAGLLAIAGLASVLTSENVVRTPSADAGASAASAGFVTPAPGGAAGSEDAGAAGSVTEAPPPTTAAACADPSVNRPACYETYFDGVVRGPGGPTAALDELATLMAADEYVTAQCHQISHDIGHSAAVQAGGDIAAAFTYGTSTCWSGYYHGVVEQTIEQFTDDDLTARMSTICPADPADPYSFDRYNCVHGLGHGVTIRTGGDVFAALPFCDALADPWDRSSCDGGVFMENIIEAQAGSTTTSLDPDDPVYPCNAVGDDHKYQCYQMVTSSILWRNGYDYAAAFETCDSVEEGYVAVCYRSMGRDISGGSLLDPVETVALCSLGSEAFRTECFEGAAANATLDHRDGVKSTELCDAVEPRYQVKCYAARDQILATF